MFHPQKVTVGPAPSMHGSGGDRRGGGYRPLVNELAYEFGEGTEGGK